MSIYTISPENYGYSYVENIKADILEKLQEDDKIDQIKNATDEEAENIYQELYDDYFVSDSITGNASGSYYCNSWRSHQAINNDQNAHEYIKEMATEYGLDSETIVDHFLNEDWEYFDVSIRCYLLGRCLQEVIDETRGTDDDSENVETA